jgi:hypothetical protein
MKQWTRASDFDTPESAVYPLIPLVKSGSVVWECTDRRRKSGITSAFRAAGFTVENPDLDFLGKERMDGFDYIITNPPFNQKDAFIERCIEYGKPFALLLPLTALEGLKRHYIWKGIENELGLLVLAKRTDFTGGGVWFNTSWFCRIPGFSGLRFALNA